MITIKLDEVNELSDLPKLRMIMEKQQKTNFFLARELQSNHRTVQKIYNRYTKSTTKDKKAKTIHYIQ